MASPTDIDLRDRFCACLLGAAIGDALAYPFEGAEPRLLDAKQIPQIARTFQQRRGGCPKGSYSDDTQLMLAVACSIIGRANVDGADVARGLLQLWRDGALSHTDEVYLCAMRRFLAGVPWTACGMPDGYNSDTAAVRAAPVGLFFCQSQAAIPEAAKRQALCTHQGRWPIAGAVVMAKAVALALTLKSTQMQSPQKFCTCLANTVRPYSQSMANLVARLPQYLNFTALQAAQTFTQFTAEPGRIVPFEGLSNATASSVMMALHSFLTAGSSFERCIEGIIRAGGNSCSVACMAGALFGARYGMKVLPQKLVRGLVYSKSIVEMAGLLFKCRPVPSGLQSGEEMSVSTASVSASVRARR